MSAIKLVYVAGPYSAPTLWGRMVHQAHAAEVARRVVQAGAYPVTPHLCTPPPFEELADVVYARAPSISADPGAQVRRVLRAWRADGEPGLAWDRQRRPSARARAMGDGRVGWQQVCRWTGEEA